ncbi:fibroblast growth factor 1-like [Hydractinia symbiolongicarpus]|uniref:fibroblast growth factor 1-like n=1 Tax=Hydractinia symbiolongicarpus TaxID=13093 RepID=UPI00254C5424|nr:fibroblast growth factor 1-like [Hydractinia symbiolongicarpus]
MTEMKEGEGIFRIETYGTSIIRLKNIKSNMYVKMTKKGHVKLTKKKNADSLFLQHHEENKFITFASEKYFINEINDMFISVKRNGRLRLAKNTEAGQKSSQFFYFVQNKTCT